MRVTRSITVPAKGIGRRDYSIASEKFVEPVISSWQNVYIHRDTITVPALGNIATDVNVPLDQVVLIYDFFASIPSNHLIRLKVDAVDSLGAVVNILDKVGLQTIVASLLKGHPFLNIIRFTTYNYRAVDEDYMRIGCAGLYTSREEYYIRIADLPVP